MFYSHGPLWDRNGPTGQFLTMATLEGAYHLVRRPKEAQARAICEAHGLNIAATMACKWKVIKSRNYTYHQATYILTVTSGGSLKR